MRRVVRQRVGVIRDDHLHRSLTPKCRSRIMASMLSLLDVLPRHEQIDIGGDKPIDVFGISGADIGEILRRYPNAFQEIADSGGQPIKMNPTLIGMLIAACQRNGDITTSFLGDEKIEARSRLL